MSYEQLRSSKTWLLLAGGVLIGLAIVALGNRAEREPEQAADDGKVKLAVIVVFDQLRGDYLERWQSLMGPDGFQRLMTEGAWFDNCHYPYAVTRTAPGHASIATGCSPNKHGIVENNWFDRASGKPVYCVDSDRYRRVPPRGKDKGKSPERLLAPTLSDVLKEHTNGKGRVVALSIKDRSAVLPGGKQPDACYWFDSSSGEFITSSYYRDAPHAWARDFNKSGLVERWRGKTWTPLHAQPDFKKFGIVPSAKDGGAFEHALDADPKSKRAYYSPLTYTPFGNELLAAFTRQAIESEKLGLDDTPDLLVISFSSNDLIGHRFGPDSPEVLDVTLRSDQLMAELLAYLDRTVGAGKYALAVSADHGVCPIPESASKQGLDAGRIPLSKLNQDAAAFLDKTYGAGAKPTRWLARTMEPWIYLNRAALEQRELDVDEVADKLARWLEKQPNLQNAFSRKQLLDLDNDDPLLRQARLSFHPERSGDVYMVQKPRYLFAELLSSGTTHGTPHDYDTHVPFIILGPGVRGGRRQEPVTPQAIAPVMAGFLEIPPPAETEAKSPNLTR